MDKAKLAQFHEILNTSDNLGCEFLKRSINDLNYSIPDTSDEGSNQHGYISGYSYLHIAAKNFDLASINELIKRKVDPIKQSHKNGQTPLHIASDRFKHKECNRYNPYESIMDYVGKLKENECVDALLSAQVKTSITADPKSADGTSHLHIACMYNHVEAVQLFSSAKESINHATNDKHQWPGYTALHFAIRYSAFEATEILLNHGADIHLKDSEGKSTLHLMIERLMDIADFLTLGETSYSSLYKQERDTLDSILKEFLKIIEGEDISDDSGLTLLHILCILKDSTLTKTFFKQDMNVNSVTKSDSKLWPGWTPLHFAACFNVETFKFLLQNGADVTIKNTKGKTPLDICMERYSPNIVHSILSLKQEFKNILFSDGSTKLLDFILLMTNDMFKIWLANLVNVDISVPLDSPIWPGYNLLHLAVLNERNHVKDAKMIFEAELSNCRSGIDEGRVDYWKQIMNCLLSKSHNFNTKNVDGLLPFFLALHLRKVDSVEMILDSRKMNDESEGLSYFHIACALGKIKVIKRLEGNISLNKPIKRDFQWSKSFKSKFSSAYSSPLYLKSFDSEFKSIHVCANSTPLHIAVIFGQSLVVKYLIENGASTYCKDQCGFDPLHLALIKENERYLSSNIVGIFLRKMVRSGKFVTKGNLHCLHIAAFCNDRNTIEELLQKGANSAVYFEPSNRELRAKFAEDIGKTPLQIAASHGHWEAERALVKGGADIFSTSEKKLLKGLIRIHRIDNDYVSILKKKKRYVIRPIDDYGLTTLHIACERNDVKWVKSLLRRRADPNSRLTSNVRSHDEATPLDIFAEKAPIWIKVNSDSVTEIAKSLFEYGADVTIKNAEGRTSLHTLYYRINDIIFNPYYDELIVKVLLLIDMMLKAQKSYDVNPTDRNELSHFHLACFTNNMDVVKEFLDAGVDVNQSCNHFSEVKRHAGWTPLHFAVNQKSSDVARLLIERGANVRAEDLRGDTPLHVLLKHVRVDMQLIELILRHGVDINAKNARGTTPIEYLFMTEAFTLQQCEFMLNHGAAIDLTSVRPPGAGVLGLVLKNAEPHARQSIFIRIANACDLKSVVKKGFNVIDSAVNVEQKGQLTVDFYLDVIEQLVDAGCNINQKDQQGKTALHRATSLYNCEAVKALLLAGANLNVIDQNGESPLTEKVVNDDRYVQRERKKETLFFLASQIWKMDIIGLNVNKSTKIIMFEMFAKFNTSFDDSWNFVITKKSCIDEYNNKVRQTFIDKLALDKFLSEWEGVMRYSRMPLAERQLIDAFFKCPENVRRDFPEWSGFLMMQYRKAVARAKMIKPAMQVIFSAGIKLPALCLEEIVEYLNYDELELLVSEY